jgi:serine protease Do
MKPGSKAKLEVVRDGQRKTLNIDIGALPEDGDVLASADGSSTKSQSNNRLGVSVTELSDAQRQALEISGGVVINDISQGPAAMIGLRPGDVITHLNNEAIDSVKTFSQVVKDLPKNRSVSMRVLRDGRASFITFKLPK